MARGLTRAEALVRAQELADKGDFVLLRTPLQDMQNLGYDTDDVAACITSCCLADVEKEMEDQYRDDRLVLVFRPIQYGEDELYVKVSVPSNVSEKLVVLSFKLSGSPR